MNQSFKFTSKIKKPIVLTAAIGLILAVVSIIFGFNSISEFWANILLNGYLYLGAAGSAMLFLAIHNIAQSGWHVSIQRVLESIGLYFPIAGIILLLVTPGITSIYEWSHPTTDKILLGKQIFLNIPFFLIRTFGFIAVWSLFIYFIRKYSLRSDIEVDDNFVRVKRLSSIYVPFFVFTFFFTSWDWIMSLEPHWYSTIFGFYMIAGAMASGLSLIILTVYLIKYFGGLQSVNDEHLHDLGKYLFGVSIFWGYLWGSQYLLIWFSNIPEESVYYVKRWHDFPVLMNVSVVLNFFVPTFLLMTRGSKRNWKWVSFVASLVFIGHWLDYFLNIMPGATHATTSNIGLLSVGMSLIFIALYLFVVLRNFASANEVPLNHPYLEESFNYENSY